MTFKTVKLPVTIYMVFNDDSDCYEGILTSITEIDDQEDSCLMIFEDMAPEPLRCKAIYSKLDGDAIHYDESGIHVFLSEKDAQQWITENVK